MALTGLLIGGKYDGGKLRPNSRGTFVWVGEPAGGTKRGDFTVFAKFRKGRELYRHIGTGVRLVDSIETDVDLYLYAGHTYSLCACGAFIDQSQLAMHAGCHHAEAA